MSKEVRRLGRGLASIVSPITQAPPDQAQIHVSSVPLQSQQSRMASLRLDQVRANPMQPRRNFDEAGLRGLADSMKSRGTLQPIVVRPSDGGYELVAGERRLRAASIAGPELDTSAWLAAAMRSE